MSRLGLAFSSFFRLLFGRKLSPAVEDHLPQELKRLPAPAGSTPTVASKPAAVASKPAAAASKPAAVASKPAAVASKPAAVDDQPEAKAPRPIEPPRKADVSAAHRDGALALLALLQRDGRLIDFLREPLDGFADADIGAAARDVHRGCKKVVDQYFTLEAVMPGDDDAKVTVPKGFDPGEIRIIGEAKGEPPLAGTLRHHGWRATRAQLPTLTEGVDRTVVAPAEVEV